jgi:chaperonin GroES
MVDTIDMEPPAQQLMDDDLLADLPEIEPMDGISLRDLAEADNIASMLDEAALMKIGDECKKGLETDEDSRADWMDKHERAMELALQVSHERTYPWEGASNMIFPLITVGALQFNARALPAIIPGNNIVKCRVNGDDSGLYEVQTDPQTGQPAMNPETGEPVMQQVVAPGSKAAQAARVSQHMNYQLLDQMTEWEADTDTILLYLPIAGCAFRRMWYDPAKGRPCSRWIPATNLIVNMKARSIENAPRISEEFKLYPYEVMEKIRGGEYYYEGDEPLDFLLGDDEENDPDDSQPSICFVEQHCRIDLDEDGYPEPYTVVFHKESGQVLKITARYNEADIEFGDAGDVVRINTVHEYIKYDFIPNPNNEFYGIGFGWLLGPINEQVNTTINQLNDAAHLQNMPMGFIGRGLRLKGGDMKFEPGEFKQVDNAGGNLRENIYQLSLEPPSQVLFQLLGLMINSGQDISSVKDIMMGDTNRNIAPTTALTLVEQGTTQFNSIFKRVHRALKHEMKLLFTINGRTLDEREYFSFFDSQEEISVSDYDPETLNVTPVTDPNMAARALRQAKTQALMQIAQMFPDRLNRDKILADLLEAAEIENPQEYILPPPPPPEPSPDEQAKLMRAETDRFRAETDREAKGARAIFDLMQAMKAKAEADTAMTTAEIEGFIQQLNTIKGELTNAPAIQGMAGAPNNGGGLA